MTILSTTVGIKDVIKFFVASFCSILSAKLGTICLIILMLIREDKTTTGTNQNKTKAKVIDQTMISLKILSRPRTDTVDHKMSLGS